MRQLIRCGMTLLAGAAFGVMAADVTVRGPDGEPKENVRIAVTGLATDADGDIDEPRLVRAASEALKPFGYYAPEITVTYENDKPVVTVALGEPVTLEAADVVVTGEAADDPDVKKLLATIPAEGSPLRHADYDSFKSKLNSLSLAKGYFDADFEKSRLEVSIKRQKARWVIHWRSGPRWKFGATQFEGSQIREDYLRSLITYQEGEAFTAEQMAAFSKNLSQTGWFDAAAVRPRFREAKDKTLPVKAAVTPRSKNEVEVGLGVDSDVGVNGEIHWTRPWINSRGQSLLVSSSASAKEQTVSAQWKLPEMSDPLNDYWLVSSGYKHTDLNDTKSRSVTATLSRTHLLPSGWQRTPSITASQTWFTQANVDESTFLLYPGLSFSRIRQRGGLSPEWGDSQNYAAEVSRREWGSGVDFALLKLQDSVLRTWRSNHRFVGRVTLGILATNDIDKVPPEKRFFAGGDKSVRGYGYQKISPKDGDGQLIGASKLATASVEYQYRVTGGWWGAVFFDAGDAVRSVSDFDLKKGAGFGVRWDSPVGPVKLDLAWPVGDPDHSGINFYVGLGAQW